MRDLRTGSMGHGCVAMALAVVMAGCSVAPVTPEALRSEVRVTPDNPANPRSVRFDVPSALLFGMPGDRAPVTLQARISTRGLAARELAAAGYCPQGFTGPDGVFFPGGDRSRSAFVVDCVG